MKAAAVIDSKMEQPPAWAKLQRELLEKQTEACVEFFGATHSCTRLLDLPIYATVFTRSVCVARRALL